MRSKVVVAALVSSWILVLASAAYAYPPKSYLIKGEQGNWLCDSLSDADETSDHDLQFKSQTYDDWQHGGGSYSYNKDRGKVRFQSGHMDHLYGKLRGGAGDYGWAFSLWRKSDDKKWGNCYYAPPS